MWPIGLANTRMISTGYAQKSPRSFSSWFIDFSYIGNKTMAADQEDQISVHQSCFPMKSPHGGTPCIMGRPCHSEKLLKNKPKAPWFLEHEHAKCQDPKHRSSKCGMKSKRATALIAFVTYLIHLAQTSSPHSLNQWPGRFLGITG